MPPTTKPTETAKPVVVLFDVGETLVQTGGSGARSWKAAFDTLYGIPADIGEHSSAGETDPQVARATFNDALDRDPSNDRVVSASARVAPEGGEPPKQAERLPAPPLPQDQSPGRQRCSSMPSPIQTAELATKPA